MMESDLISEFSVSLDLNTIRSKKPNAPSFHAHPPVPSKDIFNLGDYQVLEDQALGRGAFGMVYKARNSVDGTLVAAKQVEIGDKSTNNALVMEEIESLRTLSGHDNIVQLYEYFVDGSSIWLMMDYCDLGDMDSFFVDYEPNMTTRIKMAFMCSSAVSYMHNQAEPVVHRDIKPANILLKSRNGQVIVKISDFGLAKIIEHDPEAYTHFMDTICGTPLFMAPELILHKPYTKSVDVFALGLVFLSMLQYQSGMSRLRPKPLNDGPNGGMPIGVRMLHAYDPNAIHRKAIPVFVKVNKSDSYTMRQLKSTIESMLTYNPNHRPRMEKVTKVMLHILQEMLKNAHVDELFGTEEPSNSACDKTEDERESDIKVGDQVTTITDIAKVKGLQEDLIGCWSDEVIPYLGQTGSVLKSTEKFIKVAFPDGRKLTLHPNVVELLPKK